MVVLVGVEGIVAVRVREREELGVGGRGDGEIVRAGRAVEVGEGNGEDVTSVGIQAKSRRPVSINVKKILKALVISALRIINTLSLFLVGLFQVCFDIGNILGSPTQDFESATRQQVQACCGDFFPDLGFFEHFDDVATQSAGAARPM